MFISCYYNLSLDINPKTKMKNLYNSASMAAEIEAKFIFQEGPNDNVENGQTEAKKDPTDIANDNMSKDPAFTAELDLSSTDTDNKESMTESKKNAIINRNPQLKDMPDVLDKIMEGTFSTDESQTKEVAKNWIANNKKQLIQDFAMKTAKDWHEPHSKQTIEEEALALQATITVVAHSEPLRDSNNHIIELNNQKLYEPNYEFMFKGEVIEGSRGTLTHAETNNDGLPKYYNAYDKK